MRSDRDRALDAYLAAAARTGERKALEMLCRRWHGRLWSHAYRLSGNPDMADDITQDAWSEILRGLPGLEHAEAFPAWAYRIVTRRCARSLRAKSRRRAREDAAVRHEQQEGAITPGPETVADLARITQGMQTLTAAQRATAALFYLEGLRVAEIAVAMSVPPGTVKTRLMQARNTLRDHFTGETP